MKRLLVTIIICIIVLPIAWFLFNKFEGKNPELSILLPSVYLNRSYEMSMSVTDRGTGLRSIRVSLMQKGKEKILLEKNYENSGSQGLFMGSGVFHQEFTIPVESWKYDMKDGEAVFRIYASDYSWHGWNKGNSVYQEKNVIIDTTPPEVDILTRTHNVARGGAGLVIYRVFEDKLKSGVLVGDSFFPGYPGMFKDPNVYAAFFALSFLQGAGTNISVIVEDEAGNKTARGFYHYIKEQKFKTDIITVSDRFLEDKIKEFDLGPKELSFQTSENPLLEKFLFINRTERKENIDTVLSHTATTEPRRIWDGKPFIRLPGSANRAGYADHRIYKYKNKEIDRQVHLGIDLASIAMSPIPAANSGIVAGVGNFGIFGNTIILDHGFGLFTFYSHLSSFAVNRGDLVSKGDIIAHSGATGLAVGDHLHFGVAVNNVFVNPLEWWDKSWIDNNIMSKISDVEKLLNDTVKGTK
ncbi:MAG: M23 family metallopeptidase [Pseudomonadota bacterium]